MTADYTEMMTQFEIPSNPQNGTLWLQLSGPKAVKEFILDEFGLWQDRSQTARFVRNQDG